MLPTKTKMPPGLMNNPKFTAITHEDALNADWRLRLQHKYKVKEEALIVGGMASIVVGLSTLIWNPLDSWWQIALGAVSSGVFALGCFAFGLSMAMPEPAFRYDYRKHLERGHNKAYKRWLKSVNKLNREKGWRPREGAPHPKGRDDVYDRFLPHADDSRSGNIQLSIIQWKYNGKYWTQYSSLPLPQAVIDEAAGRAKETTEYSLTFGTDDESLDLFTAVSAVAALSAAEAEHTARLKTLDAEADESLTIEELEERKKLARMYAERVNNQPSF